MRHTKHRLTPRWIPISFLVLIWAATSWAQGASDSPALRAAEAFVDKVRLGALCPPNWEGAKVTSVEVVQTPAARSHICKLTSSGEFRGYVLLSEVNGQLTPVMYSGSAVPVELIASLQPLANGGSMGPPSQIEGPADVIMVGTCSGETKGESASTGAAASALATVLGRLQEHEGYPLFEYTALGRKDYQDAKVHQLLLQRGAAKPTSSAPATPAPSGETERTFVEFVNARQKILEEKGLVEPADASEHSSRRPTKPVSAFRALGPLFKEYLTSAARESDRMALIRAERSAARAAVGEERSLGCVNAYLLGASYLADSPTLDAAVQAFFLSRGLLMTCDRKSIAEVARNELPCVVAGPTSSAAVTLIAQSPPDNAGWAQICVHETVTTIRETLWERRQRLAAEKGVVSKDSDGSTGIDPSLPAERQEFIRQAMENAKEREKTHIVVEDPLANLPASLAEGAHMIVLGALSDWQAIGISFPVR
ncbi:MAG: hypothetical protein JXA69_12800 [Phycisphaerae bacterium]|nr:hypothetical protein [Phycisphaerae bacterium]